MACIITCLTGVVRHDYLWLSSIAPALIGYEMKKAYDYGAKKLWVFNVGDIKPAELEIQFALDMAWDISTYNATNPSAYILNWATETFGKENASPITRIKELYYQLAQAGKPEHVALLKFTQKEINERLEAYQKLYAMLDSCKEKIDKNKSDAFYQLVGYPVESACLMNIKILNEQLVVKYFNQNNTAAAAENLQLSQMAYKIIPELTERYNRFIAGGKWNGMVSWHPRDQKVFNAPKSFDSLKVTVDSILIQKEKREAQLVKRITARQLFENKNTANCKLLPGVGINGAGVAGGENASINYKLQLNAGTYSIVVKCLPTFAMEKDKQLNYTIAVSNAAVQTGNVHTEAETAVWKENVLRGYSITATEHKVITSGNTMITILLKNKNLVINQIEIYKL